MSWVVMGITGGPIVRYRRPDTHWALSLQSGYVGVSVACLVVLYYGAPAIGGMTVVGLMIHDYGICRLLTY